MSERNLYRLEDMGSGPFFYKTELEISGPCYKGCVEEHVPQFFSQLS